MKNGFKQVDFYSRGCEYSTADPKLRFQLFWVSIINIDVIDTTN